jgi:hypothetical protein
MSGRGAIGRAVVCVAVWLLLAIVASSVCLGAESAQPAEQEQAPEGVHIAVIGASVSAGFGTGIKLADVLDAAIESPKTITDLSSILFFLDPEGNAEKSIVALTQDSYQGRMVNADGDEIPVVVTFEKDPPDVVIGLDFLFWFGYGDKDTAARKAELRKGFEFLEKLDCPVVVGDLPTFAPSYMLGEELIPSDEELAALNDMIVEWAKAHERVTVYPLAALVESIRKGEPVEINGKERTLKSKDVFQLDRLHVTKTGIVALTASVVELLAQEGGPLANADVCLDPDTIAERMTAEEAAVSPEE